MFTTITNLRDSNADQMKYTVTSFTLGYIDKDNVPKFLTKENQVTRNQEQALTFESWREASEYTLSLGKENVDHFEIMRVQFKVPFEKRPDLKKAISRRLAELAAKESDYSSKIEAIKNKGTILTKDLKRGYRLTTKIRRVREHVQFLEDLQKGK